MASDSFTNTNGTALETHDSNWGNEAADLEIQGNAVQNETASSSSWATYTGSDSDYSKVTIKAESTTKSQWCSPLIRNNGAVNIGYRAVMRTRVADNWTEVRVYEASGDSVGTTHSSQTIDITQDHTLAIQATDNGAGVDLEIWVDDVKGSTINQATRTYDTGGVSGFVTTSTTDAADSAIDDWTDTEAIIPDYEQTGDVNFTASPDSTIVYEAITGGGEAAPIINHLFKLMNQ